MKFRFLLSAFFLLFFFQKFSYAQWNGDPAIANKPIISGPDNERAPRCVPDGAGGAICICLGTGQILGQRTSASGAAIWSAASDPITVLQESGSIFDMASDGHGGAYFTLQKYYSGASADVYVQYIKSNGALPFGINGIKVNQPGSHYNTDPKICATSNGVIVAWSDNSQQPGNAGYIPYAQVFAQRYDTLGTALWANGGVQVSLADSIRNVPEIVSDGNNGALIAFTDFRNSTVDQYGYYTNADVYAQHLDGNGNRLWGASDLAITTLPSSQTVYTNDYPSPAKSMIVDSAGGCIIIFRGEDWDGLYAQRITGNGTVLFPAGGLVISPGNGYHSYLQLASDGANGVVAAWSAYDFGNGFVYAQRVTGSGILPWGTNGVLVNPLANEDFSRVSITMTPDNSGNYVFGWPVQDAGNLSTYAGYKGQKLNNAGVLQWPVSGVDIFTNPNASVNFPYMVYSSNQSVITVWTDQRNYPANGTDIYGIKIGSDGLLINSPATEYFTKADGNWNDPSIWTAKQVPVMGSDVVIHNNVIVNINATVNKLTVEYPGGLTVLTGVHVTVLR